MENPAHNPVSPEAIALGYEPEALRVRGLAIFVVGFLIAMVALHALLWWLMKSMEARDAGVDIPRSVLKLEHDSVDFEDLKAVRRQEDATFRKLGWDVNPVTHEIGIPLEVVREVAEQQRARAAGPRVPPTTTGKDFNSILPGQAAETQPVLQGGPP